MDKKTISTMKKMFDDIMHTTEDGTVEFWYARELMGCLGYTTWRRFKDAINRAMESCKSAEIEVSDHFADAVKMVEIGSNAVRDADNKIPKRLNIFWRTLTYLDLIRPSMKMQGFGVNLICVEDGIDSVRAESLLFNALSPLILIEDHIYRLFFIVKIPEK